MVRWFSLSLSPRQQSLAFVLPLVAVLVTGCGQPKYPVRGVVVYDDGSVFSGGGVVAMETDIDGKRVMSRGGIGSDGRFVLASERPGDGAYAGTYRVRVLPHVVIDGPATVGIADRFQSFDTSGLTFEVGPQQQAFTIKLGPKPTR
ncbi:MAG: hypothetical protein ACR2IT_00295 [Pirellulales bacterium]